MSVLSHSSLHEALSTYFHERIRSLTLRKVVQPHRQRPKGHEERSSRRHGSRILDSRRPLLATTRRARFDLEQRKQAYDQRSRQYWYLPSWTWLDLCTSRRHSFRRSESHGRSRSLSSSFSIGHQQHAQEDLINISLIRDLPCTLLSEPFRTCHSS